MPSYIQPTFKIATVASGCYRRWLGLFNFCGHSLLMAPTRARSLVEHWRRTSLGSKHKSSSVPIKQKALRFCPNAGSLSVRLPGSTVAGGSPKTSKTSTAMHWLSSVWRPFALWSEGYVFPDELLGRTLRAEHEIDERVGTLLTSGQPMTAPLDADQRHRNPRATVPKDLHLGVRALTALKARHPRGG